MGHFFISASIELTHKANLEQTEKELQKLVEDTKKEEGCLQFEIRQNLEDRTKFTLWECWTNPEALKTHFEAPHTKAYLSKNLTQVSYIEKLGDISDETFVAATAAHP